MDEGTVYIDQYFVVHFSKLSGHGCWAPYFPASRHNCNILMMKSMESVEKILCLTNNVYDDSDSASCGY